MTRSSEDNVFGTTKEFGERWGVDYQVAHGFIKFLQAKGLATVHEKLHNSSGRGRVFVYSIPASITMDIKTVAA